MGGENQVLCGIFVGWKLFLSGLIYQDFPLWEWCHHCAICICSKFVCLFEHNSHLAPMSSDWLDRKHLGVGRWVDGKTLWNYLDTVHNQLAWDGFIIVKKDVIITRNTFHKGHPDYTVPWHLDSCGVNINYCQYHRKRPQSQVENTLRANSWARCIAQISQRIDIIIRKPIAWGASPYMPTVNYCWKHQCYKDGHCQHFY